MAARDVLYEKVFNDLKSRILSGEYLPGDMIPTEQELMSQFGVSRMTTNRALQMLTNEGLVARKAGVGTFVLDHVGSKSEKTFGHSQTDPAGSHHTGSKQSLVGFVIPFLIHSFGPGLLAALEQRLRSNGISLAVACSEGSQDIEASAIERLVDNGAQGLIVMPVNGEYYNPAILKLHVERFPIVLVDKRLAGLPVPSVCTDNVDASRRLTEHLVSLGHREIAFFSPTIAGTSTLQDRFTGFSQAMEAAGLRVNPSYCIETTRWDGPRHELDAGQLNAVVQFLERNPKVSAVFATDDDLAKYWHTAARSVGRRVPEDLAIVCFDGLGPYRVDWTFTSAMQDQELMAEHAVRVLLDLLQDKGWEQPDEVLVPANIFVGESTVGQTRTRLEHVET
ncbi:GntR family transcriptional regulator [Alicyclobacillus acidiphilus]|uniref:GntR family transcriptional regulator n=1 Tax=Alicyclobacillus acidiphilus TaxID=182455 RepID=UPI0009FACE9B|nr:GntR family transcriptional regulator [Alicyclobacillus acidiphilus]